jgi:hypothetical protein
VSQIELVCCTFCGTRITQADLEQGKSVRVLKKFYCFTCMNAAMQRGRSKPAPPPPPPVASPATAPIAPPPAPSAPAGTHVCGLYSSEEERREQLGPFVREGILKGEKILRFVNLATPERILSDFLGVGLPVQSCLQNNQLEILSASKVLNAVGGFDPDDLSGRLARAADRARAAGSTGFRIAAEMTWALNSLIDADRLSKFEERLDALVGAGRCTALCQYNVYRLEQSSLDRLRGTHSGLHAHGTAESVLRDLAVFR